MHIPHGTWYEKNALIPTAHDPYLTSIVGSLDDFSVGGRIISLDVRVDGLLHHRGLELGLGQLTPDSWLVATLGKLIGTVQVTNMVDEHLRKRQKGKSEV